MVPVPRGHDGDSRARVLSLLRAAEGPLTAAEIGRRAHLAVATTRFHLEHLVADGCVECAPEAPSGRPGRPRMMYRALPEAVVDDGAAYRLLAGLLADQLLHSHGSAGPLEAGRRWAASSLAVDVAAGADVTAGGDVTAAVIALFTDGGFAPRAVDASTVELRRCPFLDLARTNAEAVCAVHLGFLQGLLTGLGSDRQPRLEVVLDGSGPCLVRLALPPADHGHRTESSPPSTEGAGTAPPAPRRSS